MEHYMQMPAFNVQAMFEGLGEYLNTGDPQLREWFLVKSNFWPIFLCTVYLLTIKVIGPAIMRNRKPFELRKTMIAYNVFLVAAYATSVSIFAYCMWDTKRIIMCQNTAVANDKLIYTMATWGWVIYLLKYVEFLDTIFFILRKKDNLITNLHVIHHTIVPIICWVAYRTEKSGFIVYPAIINSIIHIIMYSYYALAAMGPSVRKYLWWKRYLTIAQMVQFILILFIFNVIKPLYGCAVAKSSMYMSIIGCTFFFILFYNYYQHSFKSRKLANNGTIHKPMTNDQHAEGKVKCN